MGFYDELKQTSQQNYVPPTPVRPFPEKGVDEKVQWLANDAVTKIKKDLSEFVELKIFSDGAYHSGLMQNVIISCNESHIKQEPYRTPQIYFSSWEAAETYYTLINKALTAERLYHKWYIDYGIKGKKYFFTFESYLYKLHSQLKKRWDVIEQYNRLSYEKKHIYKSKHMDVFNRPDLICLEVILPCDSYGVIR